MAKTRSAPEATPTIGGFLDPDVILETVPAQSLADLKMLMSRSAAMGVFDFAGDVVDGPAIRDFAEALKRYRIGSNTASALVPLLEGRAGEPGALEAFTSTVDLLGDAIEASAVPEAEWPAMRAVFGDEQMTDLLGIGLSSMRRYAAGERKASDLIVARLHWLAMVVADLAGSYNDFGIRRWFVRPRVQLDGLSPRQVLGDDWTADGPAAQRVRALSSVLAGAHPLAA